MHFEFAVVSIFKFYFLIDYCLTNIETNLNKKLNFKIDLGTSLQIQSKATIVYTLNSQETEVIRKTNGGIYPLFHLGLGFELSTKNNKKINMILGINQGFIENESLNYNNINQNLSKNYSLTGSYYEIKFNWRIFQSL